MMIPLWWRATPTCAKSTTPLTGVCRSRKRALFNGMLLEGLEKIPEINTRVKVADYAIDILNVQDNMVKQVRITLQTPLETSVGS